MAKYKEVNSNHPSFGMISIARSQGLTNLVGSEITHSNFFHLSIKEAEKSDSFGATRFFGHKSLIDIWLSPNQFLDLVTQLNVSEGVPCTLRYVAGVERERPVAEQSRVEKAADYGKQEVLDSIKDNKEMLKELMALLEKVPAKTKSQVERILNTMIDNQNANAQFYLQRITEATEKSIQIAKTEIDSYVSGVVRQLGVDSLQTLSKALNLPEER